MSVFIKWFSFALLSYQELGLDIDSSGEDLHEVSKPIFFSGKIRKYRLRVIILVVCYFRLESPN